MNSRKKNHLKTNISKPININIPSSPVYTASSTANQQSPDSAAVFSIGVKVGRTTYTVRNSTATSGGILVNLGKIWKNFNNNYKDMIDSVDNPEKGNTRSGIESFYLGLLLWEKTPKKSLNMFKDAVKQEPGSKLMQLFHGFIQTKYKLKDDDKNKKNNNKVDELQLYMRNTFTIYDFNNNIDNNFSFMHRLDFSPFVSPSKLYPNIHRIIKFCETSVSARNSPRNSPNRRNSPRSGLVNSPKLSGSSNFGAQNFELNRRLSNINDVGLSPWKTIKSGVSLSPSSYKRKLSVEKEIRNKKSMCIVLSGGEHRMITQLLTSIEQKDEYSYSSIHLIGGNKKACNKVLAAIASTHNGALPCPVFISNTFSHVSQSYDVGICLYNVELMSEDFRRNCFEWMSKHCDYVILGVFDIPQVLNYTGNEVTEENILLEPSRVAHLVQSFEHGLQKKNLSFSINLFNANSSSSDDDIVNDNNENSNSKNSNSNIKSDYLLDLFYKLLISKDINRDVRSDNAFGRNVPSNYLSLKRWVMDLQEYGFCIEKAEHVYDHWWAPVYLIWGTNATLLSNGYSPTRKGTPTRKSLLAPDIKRDTTQLI